MNGQNPYAMYRQTAAETATPTRQVVMLYDGALRFLNQALPAMQRGDLEGQSLFIGKAQAIIAHLRATLDFAAGGQVAHALLAFYVAAYDTLTWANIKDDTGRLQTVIAGLREMRDGWVEVDRQCQSLKSAPQKMAV